MVDENNMEFTAKVVDSNGTLRVTIPKYISEVLHLDLGDIVKVNVSKIDVSDK